MIDSNVALFMNLMSYGECKECRITSSAYLENDQLIKYNLQYILMFYAVNCVKPKIKFHVNKGGLLVKPVRILRRLFTTKDELNNLLQENKSRRSFDFFYYKGFLK